VSDLLALEVTDADLAALAGVSTRRIRQLVEAGRLTRIGRNRYALGDAFAALVEEMAGGDKASELTAERVRKLRADASLAELELAKATGLVAPIGEMERVWRHSYALVRTNMLNIPRRVVTSLVGETDERRITEVLKSEITQVLRDAAEQPMELPEDE